MSYAQAIREQIVTARKARGWSQTTLAEKAGIKQSTVSRIESTTRGIDVDEFVAIATVLGLNAGDMLPNSAGLISRDIRPLVETLKRLDAPVRERTLRIVEQIVGIQDDLAMRPQSRDNVVAFPSQEHTPPRWTPEFPVQPNDFNAKGDTDFPIELHGWEMDDIDAAAGDVGIQNAENQMGTILNMKEVREGRVRSIKVKGNSMAPTFEHGWLIAVDVTQRTPKNEDPVLVYRHETDGMILGRWEQRGERVRLLKDNDEFDPVELLEGDMLLGTVIDIIKKPVPPPPARRKR